MPNRPHTLIESWLPFDAIGAEACTMPTLGRTLFALNGRCGLCLRASKRYNNTTLVTHTLEWSRSNDMLSTPRGRSSRACPVG